MDELQEVLHKFERETDHLLHLTDEHGGFTDEYIDLALSQAKRVRRESTLLVRALARHRDQLQPKEGTST